MASTAELVRIHYHRPPNRTDVFEQVLLERSSACVVTFLEDTPLRAPLIIGGRSVLENHAPAVWFTFPDAWHDIGRFYSADGSFTGFYANILTPVRFLDRDAWETTDLFLDVWLDAHGGLVILDEDELNAALAQDWIDERTAARAREEAAAVTEGWRRGEWPPAIVHQWTLPRARAAAARS